MEKIIEFIKRRFPTDNNWCNGNCYFFALILSETFHGDIFYDPIIGHFVAKIDGVYYDWNGVYETDEELINWKTLKEIDPIWARRLERDCVR